MEAWERVKDFLTGAEACFESGSLAACALCCYAAVFWGQIAVLERLGFRQPRWSHEGLRSKFALEAIKKRRLFPKEASECARTAYELRHDAHYSLQHLPPKSIERLLRHTRDFAQQVQTFLRK